MVYSVTQEGILTITACTRRSKTGRKATRDQTVNKEYKEATGGES